MRQKHTNTHTHGHTHVPFALLFSMHNCRSWLCPSWEPSTEVICIGFRHGLATGGCCAQPIQGTARVWTHDGWCMRPNDHDLLCGAMKQPNTHMHTIGYHWHEQKNVMSSAVNKIKQRCAIMCPPMFKSSIHLHLHASQYSLSAMFISLRWKVSVTCWVFPVTENPPRKTWTQTMPWHVVGLWPMEIYSKRPFRLQNPSQSFSMALLELLSGTWWAASHHPRWWTASQTPFNPRNDDT